VELHVCEGPKDPKLLACNHDWKRFEEKGCSDSKAFYHCPSCGLTCPVAVGEAYPAKCLEYRKAQIRGGKNEFNACSGKNCKVQTLNLVNAKDFEDPRNRGCSECETE
jgi:hypothetical protein